MPFMKNSKPLFFGEGHDGAWNVAMIHQSEEVQKTVFRLAFDIVRGYTSAIGSPEVLREILNPDLFPKDRKEVEKEVERAGGAGAPTPLLFPKEMEVVISRYRSNVTDDGYSLSNINNHDLRITFFQQVILPYFFNSRPFNRLPERLRRAITGIDFRRDYQDSINKRAAAIREEDPNVNHAESLVLSKWFFVYKACERIIIFEGFSARGDRAQFLGLREFVKSFSKYLLSDLAPTGDLGVHAILSGFPLRNFTPPEHAFLRRYNYKFREFDEVRIVTIPKELYEKQELSRLAEGEIFFEKNAKRYPVRMDYLEKYFNEETKRLIETYSLNPESEKFEIEEKWRGFYTLLADKTRKVGSAAADNEENLIFYSPGIIFMFWNKMRKIDKLLTYNKMIFQNSYPGIWRRFMMECVRKDVISKLAGMKEEIKHHTPLDLKREFVRKSLREVHGKVYERLDLNEKELLEIEENCMAGLSGDGPVPLAILRKAFSSKLDTVSGDTFLELVQRCPYTVEDPYGVDHLAIERARIQAAEEAPRQEAARQEAARQEATAAGAAVPGFGDEADTDTDSEGEDEDDQY
jgi:hypothetical protein